MITRSIAWKHQLYYDINLDDNVKSPNHKQQTDTEKKVGSPFASKELMAWEFLTRKTS